VNPSKPNCEFFNQDCIEFLCSLSSNSVDLVLADPPYVISRDTGFKAVVAGERRFAVSMDFGNWDKDVLNLEMLTREIYRVLKRGGTSILFYDLWKITDLKRAYDSAHFKQIRLIEWMKTNPVPLNARTNYLTNAREVAVLAVKGRPTFNSNYDNGVYRYPICHAKDRFHPTQKPLALMEDLVRKHSRPGDLVVDCFSGSATTGVAALRQPEFDTLTPAEATFERPFRGKSSTCKSWTSW